MQFIGTYFAMFALLDAIRIWSIGSMDALSAVGAFALMMLFSVIPFNNPTSDRLIVSSMVIALTITGARELWRRFQGSR